SLADLLHTPFRPCHSPRPARLVRAARLRDAPAPADGRGADAPGALAGRVLCFAAIPRPPGALGHGAARSLPSAPLALAGLRVGAGPLEGLRSSTGARGISALP